MLPFKWINTYVTSG